MNLYSWLPLAAVARGEFTQPSLFLMSVCHSTRKRDKELVLLTVIMVTNQILSSQGQGIKRGALPAANKQTNISSISHRLLASRERG